MYKRAWMALKTLPLRANPALRWSGELTIAGTTHFDVAPSSNICCRLWCEGGSFRAGDRAAVARGSEIVIGENGSVQLGAGVTIGRNSLLAAAGTTVMIGDSSTFYSTLFLSGSVSIGRDCLFGPHVTALSGTHVIDNRRPIREQDADYARAHGGPPDAPIVIGDDVWVGANAVILPGVQLETGCVVGAGSVVTHSFEPYSVIGGVPAKVIKYR